MNLKINSDIEKSEHWVEIDMTNIIFDEKFTRIKKENYQKQD